MDLGFVQAGFEIAYANDIDKEAGRTYLRNFGMALDRRSILDVKPEEIPDADVVIGGPPCQSWSVAGALRGEDDPRGKLFFEYIRLLEAKQPKAFIAENVPGIAMPRNSAAFRKILKLMSGAGYNVAWKILDARDFCLAQERKRVIVAGIRKDIGSGYSYPGPLCTKEGSTIDGIATKKWKGIREALAGLPEAVPALEKNKPNPNVLFPNHEYMVGSFSTIYMSRNRRRGWDSQSFTIQAGGRHAPLYPGSCAMEKVSQNKWVFTGNEYRRLTVREAARIQTFPDDFIFIYKSLADGYKMVGNAVPVKLAYAVAKKIAEDFAAAPDQIHKIAKRRKGKAIIDNAVLYSKP